MPSSPRCSRSAPYPPTLHFIPNPFITISTPPCIPSTFFHLTTLHGLTPTPHTPRVCPAPWLAMPGTCQTPNEPGASPAASRGDLGPRTTPTSTLPTSLPYQPNPYAPTSRAPSELPPARRTRAPIPTAAATTASLDATTALLAAPKQNSDVAATALATAYTALKNKGLGRHSRQDSL